MYMQKIYVIVYKTFFLKDQKVKIITLVILDW